VLLRVESMLANLRIDLRLGLLFTRAGLA